MKTELVTIRTMRYDPPPVGNHRVGVQYQLREMGPNGPKVTIIIDPSTVPENIPRRVEVVTER